MQEIGYDGYIGYELCHPIPHVDGEARRDSTSPI